MRVSVGWFGRSSESKKGHRNLQKMLLESTFYCRNLHFITGICIFFFWNLHFFLLKIAVLWPDLAKSHKIWLVFVDLA